MDPEIKQLIEETHALAQENNRILRAIRRSQWFGFFSKIIIWAIVLLLPLYLYQQYLQPLISKFSSSTSTPSDFLNLPTSTDVQNLINSYGVGQQ